MARVSLGTLLILMGSIGFLPVLGFWMIPLGLLVLSYDIHPIRRIRRRFLTRNHRNAKSRERGN